LGDVLDVDGEYGYTFGNKFEGVDYLNLSRFFDKLVFTISPFSGITSDNFKITRDVLKYIVGRLDEEVYAFFLAFDEYEIEKSLRLAQQSGIKKVIFYVSPESLKLVSTIDNKARVNKG